MNPGAFYYRIQTKASVFPPLVGRAVRHAPASIPHCPTLFEATISFELSRGNLPRKRDVGRRHVESSIRWAFASTSPRRWIGRVSVRMPQNEFDIPFYGKNWGPFGKEIRSWSLNDYRRSILENRIIIVDVRGEARAEPLKRNDLRQKQVGLRSLVAHSMARKAWYSPYLVILRPWWVTDDMASNARHDPISDEHHLVTGRVIRF